MNPNGPWTQIGYLTEKDGQTFSRLLVTPGEIENCVRCGEHARNCVNDKNDLDHMRGFHIFHTHGIKS